MRYVWIFVSVAVFLAAGCVDENAQYLTADRLANGLVIILPGIEGVSPLNRDVRAGLIAGGVHRGFQIYGWGRPIPLAGMLLNQVDFIGNRLAGDRIAKLVVQYQDDHPGKPVYIVGHSGGGGVAVFAAEGMPDGRQVDGLVLLSASINSNYDLTKALGRCRNGILNCYNRGDAAMLGIGTTVVGNVDGTHGPSAGLTGFAEPSDTDSPEKRLAYRKLYETMVAAGGDAHASTTRVGFVSTQVAPWILSSSWPAGTGGFSPLPLRRRSSAKALAHIGR